MNRSELIRLLNERSRRQATRAYLAYRPYPFQQRFHAAGKDHQQILLMAANRVGKTYSGAMELAFHLTGLYPEDWPGHRYERPTRFWAAGSTNEKTRDILQAALLGDPKNPDSFGTAAVPLETIVGRTRKPGIPNALSAFAVRHVTGGNSVCAFKAYEMGPEAFMGESEDGVLLDEEPPEEIYNQCLVRILDRRGRLWLTFTPEKGATALVTGFLNELKPGQIVLSATWDDAPHLDEETKKQILAAIPEYEREMRSRGLPKLGTGNVFRVPESALKCEPFDIPSSFAQIGGLDFGMNHGTAFAQCAYDRDSKIFYVVRTYKQKDKILSEYICDAREFFGKSNVAWPHDGHKRDPGSGEGLALQYRLGGVKMLPRHFTNPPGPGQDEGQGGIAREPGLRAMESAMTAGRFKVFDTPENNQWFQEYRMYHRDKNGDVVDVNDDLMSATRVAFQSVRFARSPEQAKLPSSYLTEPGIELRV